LEIALKYKIKQSKNGNNDLIRMKIYKYRDEEEDGA